MSGNLCVLINGGILGMLGQGLRLAYLHYRWVIIRKNDTYFWNRCNPIVCLLLSFLVGYGVMGWLQASEEVMYTLTFVILSGTLSPIPFILLIRLFRTKNTKSKIKFS
ncbi:MAG: hypothetical protein RLZZ500_944 [Bacteroidota bacterium]|jgi:hypothetical protein